MTADDAKAYLCKREIPQLFECLMTGLMYHRPREHIKYLQECLKKIDKQGLASVRWNMFIEQRRKTPLPPITPDNKRRQSPDKRSRGSSRHSDRSQHSPLPPIVAPKYERKQTHIKLPDVPIVIMMGGPGSGKGAHCERMLDRYPTVIHVSMGDLLRKQATQTANSRWGMVSDILKRGEMAPQEMAIEILCEELQKYPKAGGFVIEGYPRTSEQVRDYEEKIGRVDTVMLLDCEEYRLQQRLVDRSKNTNRLDDNLDAIASRILFFKQNTLPVVKKYDDVGILAVIEGDKDDDDVQKDIQAYCDPLFPTTGKRSPRPPSSRKSSARSSARGRPRSSQSRDSPLPDVITHVADVSLQSTDEGRKEDLPQCPIVLVMGGPGSGKGTQCKRITERYEGFAHISMGDVIRDEVLGKGSNDDKWSAIGQLLQKGEMAPEDVTDDLLKTAIKKHADAKVIFLEGYPRDEEQLNAFYKHVGGVNLVLLLDCEEYYLKHRLISRQHDSGRIDDNLFAISSRINVFKNKTLSVVKHFDQEGKLFIVNGDRDSDEIYFDLCQFIDSVFFAPPEDANQTEGGASVAADQSAPADTSEVTAEADDKQEVEKTGDDKDVVEKSDTAETEATAPETETTDESPPVAEETMESESVAPTGGDEGNPDIVNKIQET